MRISTAAFFAVSAVAVPSGASAATIVQSYGPQLTSQLITRFDPSLGILNSVTGEFTGVETAQIQTNLVGPVNVNYTAKGFYSVYIGPLFFDFTGSAQGAGVASINASGIGTITLSGGTIQTRTAVSELAVFTGVGTILASPTADPPFMVSLSSGALTGQPTVLTKLTSYKITYDYTPFAQTVPEPLSWALFVVGFGLLGGRLRSRGRTVNAPQASLRRR